MYGIDGMSHQNIIQNGQAMGVYTAENQFNFDENMLRTLGFNDALINTFKHVMMNNIKPNVVTLQSYGLTFQEAKKIHYMYDIITGKVEITTKEELVKHLRKMFGTGKRITINDLAISTVSNVPRVAVVGGIKDPRFKVFNSSDKRFPPKDRMYPVKAVSGQRVHVVTRRRPVLKYGDPKKIDGVLEITKEYPDGRLEVAFAKKYCKLCNRFIIVASTRKPERHHGLIEIICIEGTRIYVYAQSLGTKDKVSYNGGTQRVYDYGFFEQEIKTKLFRSAAMLYPRICGVTAYEEPAIELFQILLPDNVQQTYESPYDTL